MLEAPIVSAVSSAVTTAAPNAPPTVRMIVLIPVATPTSLGSTRLTMRFAIDANPKEMPTPRMRFDAMNCAVVSCASARIANEIALATVPAARTARKPMRLPSRPASGPQTSITNDAGAISSPDCSTVMPNP